jgi:hypothetical protein
MASTKFRSLSLGIIAVQFLMIQSNQISAQIKTDTMSKISKLHNTIRINSSVEKVWTVLGNLSACSEWIPGIVSSKLDNEKRTCTTADNNIIVEEISNYSEKKKSFSYIHLQSPMPVKDSKGAFLVKKDGDGALVIWDASFEVLDQAHKQEVTNMLNGYYIQSLNSLKKVVESK